MAQAVPGDNMTAMKDEPADNDEKGASSAEPKVEVKLSPEAEYEQLHAAAMNGDRKETALSFGQTVMNKFGGPLGVLLSLAKDDHGKELALSLKENFSTSRSDLPLVNPRELPDNPSDLFVLQLHDLSYFLDSSTKPAPYLATCVLLWNDVLTNTFVTEGLEFGCDPLVVWDGPPPADRDWWAWTQWVKGACRATMAVFTAALSLHCKWDLSILAPKLYESLQCVWARRDMGSDITTIAFANARLSARGEIRRAHDIACWLSKLNLLKSKGLKPDVVIQAWNSQATQQAQLGGSKRVAILFLLGCPPEAVELLLKHASEFGTASAFPEEAFAKKALQIGFTPRGMPKDWVRRLTVTEKSFLLRTLRYVDCEHHRTLKEIRGKLSADDLAGLSQMAALVSSLHTELTEQGVNGKSLIDNFLAGDSQLFCVSVSRAAETHEHDLAEKFVQETFKSPTPLTTTTDVDIQMPDFPALSLLTPNNKTKTPAGLTSLSTPAKVLTQWHDHVHFQQEFRTFLQEQREKFPLDLAPAASRTRPRDETDNNPSSAKRARITNFFGGPKSEEGDGQGPKQETSEDDFLDASDLGVPMTHEAAIGTTKLHMVVTVGNGVFLINRHTDAVTCKAGTVLAGYYKGKFESSETPVKGNDVVSFELKDSKDLVMSAGRVTRLGEMIKTKRLTNPNDATISFHELQDAPTWSIHGEDEAQDSSGVPCRGLPCQVRGRQGWTCENARGSHCRCCAVVRVGSMPPRFDALGSEVAASGKQGLAADPADGGEPG
ncbi:unnamed protein product [Symbiodinium sp. CCMP2592]|nr:unnamed protein product [Symbiodinium sp. CCMP2592]